MKKIFPIFLTALFLFTSFTSTLAQKKNTFVLFTTSSNEARASFNEGLKYNDMGEQKKAKALFQKAIQQDPSLVAAYLYAANFATSPEEFASNLAKAKQNLSNASDWEKLYYDFTETNLRNDLDKQLATAKKMTESYPNVARAYYYLGQAYSARNEFAQARQNYQKAVSLEPSWPGGYLALASSYVFEEPKDFKQGEINARKLTQLAPNSAGGYIILGDAYRAQNQLDKARDAYSKSIQLDSQSPMGYYKRGHALTFLGDFDKARSDYQQGGSLDERPTFATTTTAFTYLYQDQPKKALDFLMDNISKMESMPENAQTAADKFDLLNTAFQIAFHTQDGQHLQDIIDKMQPLSEQMGKSLGTTEAELSQKADMLFRRGLVKAMNHDYSGALAYADEIKTTLDPIQSPRKLEDYEALMGYISYQQKDFPSAISHFEKANRLSVYNRYWLAKAYEASGDKDKAMAIYKELANYNFNDIGFALIRNEVRKKV